MSARSGLHRAVLAWAALCLGLPCPAPSLPTGWVGLVAVEQVYNDNIQQRQGRDREADLITRFAGQLGWKSRPSRPLPEEMSLTVAGHLYHQYDSFSYFELRPEASYPLWWRLDLLLAYHFSPRRLLFEEEDAGRQIFYSEHAYATGIQRKFGKRRRLRARLLFQGLWQNYREPNDGRDSFTPGLLWDARYRLDLGDPPVLSLVPQLLFEYAARSACRENFDREEYVIGPGMAFELPRDVQLRLRYERSFREYSVDTPRAESRNGNFDRFDDLHQLQILLGAPLPWHRELAFTLRYRFRHGALDKPNRTGADGSLGLLEHFDVHETGVGMEYRF